MSGGEVPDTHFMSRSGRLVLSPRWLRLTPQSLAASSVSPLRPPRSSVSTATEFSFPHARVAVERGPARHPSASGRAWWAGQVAEAKDARQGGVAMPADLVSVEVDRQGGAEAGRGLRRASSGGRHLYWGGKAEGTLNALWDEGCGGMNRGDNLEQLGTGSAAAGITWADAPGQRSEGDEGPALPVSEGHPAVRVGGAHEAWLRRTTSGNARGAITRTLSAKALGRADSAPGGSGAGWYQVVGYGRRHLQETGALGAAGDASGRDLSGTAAEGDGVRRVELGIGSGTALGAEGAEVVCSNGERSWVEIVSVDGDAWRLSGAP